MKCGIFVFPYTTKLSAFLQKRMIEMFYEITILRRGIVESVTLLGCYTAEDGNWLPAFWYYVSVSFAKGQAGRFLLGVLKLEYETDRFYRNITNQLQT